MCQKDKKLSSNILCIAMSLDNNYMTDYKTLVSTCKYCILI